MHDGDLRSRHLAHEFVHEFTHLDGKVLRTLRALLFQPGRLTREYWDGRRGPWVRPLRLYLVISALQLLLAANSSGPLGLRVWAVNGSKPGQNFVVGTRPVGQLSGSPINEELNHRIQSVYLWVRYLSLGVFAAAGLLAYRKLQPYYGAHLIFGLHYYSFEYLVNGLTARIAPDAGPPIAIPLGFVYLLLALRKLYGQKFGRTFAKSLLLFLAVALAEMLIVVASVWTVIQWR